ncbi:MAG: ABC transporter permease [Micrococcales bacterium]|nr:ABC transporter permease [Micrococcales bacterium]
MTAAGSSALLTLSSVGDVARLVAVVAVCAVLAALVRRASGLGQGREELVAVARATVQLALVGAVIALVLQSWWATATFLALMVVVASWTSAGRMGLGRRGWILAPVALGALPVTVGLLASGLLPLQPIAVIPTAGILIGNAMTATTLGGKRSLDALVERRGEYEAGLSIGLMARDAALLVSRDAARLALLPGLDQTRTVGIVTLPGAFVGTLLGGATPLEAAALQLVVLAGILLSQSVAVALVLELVVRGTVRAPAHAG